MKDDTFLLQYKPVELKMASEILTTWLPFLRRDLCHDCTRNLSHHVRSLDSVLGSGGKSESFILDESRASLSPNKDNCDMNSLGSRKDAAENNLLTSWKDCVNGWSENDVEVASTIGGGGGGSTIELSSVVTHMAQEDDLEKPKLSVEEREYLRFAYVKRKKDFSWSEKIKGKYVNILVGLELHKSVFSAVEQEKIVNHVYLLHEKGKNGELEERTYTAPRNWMKGKGRVTLQFGCCYNYVKDKNGNPPGILKKVTVDLIPHLFKMMIKRLVKWHIVPSCCVPDSCIVNIYEVGDCIPPHIDSHDFLRPFCTVSFLCDCDIFFGSNLKIGNPGEFAGPIGIPLPVGSVLVLNGNAADVVKHCVTVVHTKRISITFRKMDESKRPIRFILEPLHGIETLSLDAEKTKLLTVKRRRLG